MAKTKTKTAKRVVKKEKRDFSQVALAVVQQATGAKLKSR